MTGPGQISTTSPSTPKSFSFFSMSRAFMVSVSLSWRFAPSGGGSSRESGGVLKSPSALMKSKASCTGSLFFSSLFFSFFATGAGTGGGTTGGLMTGAACCLGFSSFSFSEASSRASARRCLLFSQLSFSAVIHQLAKRMKEKRESSMALAASIESRMSIAPILPKTSFRRPAP